MNQPHLSIIVPAFNEERTIGSMIDRLHAACPFAQIIFVNDGSTDRTFTIMGEKKGSNDLVLTKKNEGKGSAVRAGYAQASGIYVVVQDADLEYSPEELPAMLAVVERGNLPAMFGSRRIHDEHKYAHIKFYFGGIILTGIFNLLYGTHLTDQPHCYKMVRADILRTIPLTQNDFAFDAELAAQLAKRGIPIAEFATAYHPRSVEEGKKIGWRDWFRAVWVFMRVRVGRS